MEIWKYHSSDILNANRARNYLLEAWNVLLLDSEKHFVLVDQYYIKVQNPSTVLKVNQNYLEWITVIFKYYFKYLSANKCRKIFVFCDEREMQNQMVFKNYQKDNSKLSKVVSNRRDSSLT